jgi:hypothetical protein
MAKNKENFMQSSRSHWLRLSLELIAVFVGISAGFFVNSYQQKKSEQKLEVKYLESFQKNLVVDSIEIKTHIEEDQNNLDISRRAVFTMIEGKLHNDSALALMSVIAAFNNLNMQDATYESIVNSGNLGLIRDYELREELVNYYRYQASIRDVEQVYNDYIKDYVMPLFFNSIDMLAGSVAEGFSADTREFRNINAGYYVLAQQKMDILMELDSVNNALIPKVALARNLN